MFRGQVLVYIHFYNDTANVDCMKLWCQAKLASFERMLPEVPACKRQLNGAKNDPQNQPNLPSVF